MAAVPSQNQSSASPIEARLTPFFDFDSDFLRKVVEWETAGGMESKVFPFSLFFFLNGCSCVCLCECECVCVCVCMCVCVCVNSCTQGAEERKKESKTRS